jgi:hypothetical protein
MQILIPWLALGLVLSAVCGARRLSLGFLAGLLVLLSVIFTQPFGSPAAVQYSRNSWIKQLSGTEALLNLGDGRQVVLTAPPGNITPALAANAVAALRAAEQATGQVEVAPGEAFRWGGLTLTYAAATGGEKTSARTELLDRAKEGWPLLLLSIGAGCSAFLGRWAFLRRKGRGLRLEQDAKERQARETRERHAYEAALARRMREAEEEAQREAARLRYEQQASEPPSWWEVLGLAPSASWSDVQATYRAKIQKYHPDRVHGMGPEIVRIAEDITAELNRARAEAEADHRSNPVAQIDQGEQFASTSEQRRPRA